MTKFNMDELDAGDGKMFTGDNPNDVLEADNLLEVGVSKELAAGLDGKTIGEFQEIMTNVIASGADVNLEMFEFAQALFVDQNPETGYENNAANAVLTTFEHKLMDAWPTKEVQGLAFQYEGETSPIAGEAGSPALPAAMQPEAAEAPGSGYFGTRTPTDIAMEKMDL